MRPPEINPEVVVGVDFGMTCTGVAYSYAPEWPEPKTILQWPGKLGHENRNKVDTAIAYNRHTGAPETWGFLINQESRDLEVQDLFKLYLDYSHQDEFRGRATVEVARGWFRDYLCFLYAAIARNFDDWLPRWRSKGVEFVFSVPTTWKDPGMIAEIEGIIRSTGFCEQSNFRARVTLTEAEAAAVCVSKQAMEKGDVYLVCDAGGGTTDVNALKIRNAASGQVVLEPLSWVEGRAVGSTLIDFKMQKILFSRLEAGRYNLPAEPALLAERMIGTEFESYKCSFGTDAYAGVDLMLHVPGMQPGVNLPQVGIRDSRLVVSRLEIQQLFDEQITKMFALVDTQLQRLQTEHPHEKVAYIVLSGGLGSSTYVKQQFRKRYQSGDITLHNAASLQVLTALVPQLAVVHGLVIDRVQSLRDMGRVFAERCSRTSYGIVVRALYNPVDHLGEDVVVDPRDKTKWAERQIHWLVKQGERISVDRGVSRRYRLKLDLGKEQIPWRTQVVKCALPAVQLPRSMKDPSVKPVCVVESKIDNRDLKLKNRHWYNFGPQYYRAEFDVRIIVGAADVKFQLWGDGDNRLSRDHEDIEVSWNAPGEQRGASVMITNTDNGLYAPPLKSP